MTGFINDDHRQVVDELATEMLRLGFIDDGTGNFVPAPTQQAAPVAPQAPPAYTQPPPSTPQSTGQAQPAPVLSQPTTPLSSGHDWAKREADARQAQRDLSLERNAVMEERQALARERAEALNVLQSLKEQSEALAARATQVPAAPLQVLTEEFRREYPDIAAAIEQVNAANQAEIQRIRLEQQQEQDHRAIEHEQNRRRLFLDAVRNVHRDYDDIVASEAFKQWAMAQARSTRLVLEETFNTDLSYEPQDLVDVITRFKLVARPTHVPPQVPPGLTAVDPTVRSLPDSSEPSGKDDFVFSLKEMRDPSLIDRWMKDPNHRRNPKVAMDEFDAAWARSVAYHNRNRNTV
jgi:hypothetical protein